MRSAVKEQIESLGARFLELDMGLEDAEAPAATRAQLTDEEQQRQRELLAEEIGKMTRSSRPPPCPAGARRCW